MSIWKDGLALVLLAIVLGSCAAPTALSPDYGSSYETARNGQILHPGADRNLAPATDLAGRAAAIVFQQYLKSFEGEKGGQGASEPKNVLVGPMVPMK